MTEESSSEQGAEEKPEGYRSKRPPFISLMCLFWAGITPVLIMMYLNPDPQRPYPESYGQAFVPLSITFEVAKFIGLLGMWWMRKFGVVIYALATAAHIGMLLTIGADPQAIVRTCGFAVVNSVMGFAYFQRMR